MKDHRYIAFGGHCYYPHGGAADHIDSSEYLEDAVKAAKKWAKEHKDDDIWWHVWDYWDDEIVKEGPPAPRRGQSWEGESEIERAITFKKIDEIMLVRGRKGRRIKVAYLSMFPIEGGTAFVKLPGFGVGKFAAPAGIGSETDEEVWLDDGADLVAKVEKGWKGQIQFKIIFEWVSDAEWKERLR